MLSQIRHLIVPSTDPCFNLALEEYLLRHVQPDECILYLWQNQKTVVIGRHQNGWKECRADQLRQDGGRVVRRLSGGGAVFHDLGNLNFTFLAARGNYDLDRQMKVLLRALGKWKIPAELTGRNDICVEGRKVSGNAFYSSRGQMYHHGTLLLNINTQDAARYLSVSADKLRSKSVDSVPSRIANLAEYRPDITVEGMIQALLDSFEEIYALPASPISEGDLNSAEVEALSQKYVSWDWTFGPPISFTYSASRRFSWGDLQAHFEVKSGRVVRAVFYSDTLDTDLLPLLSGAAERSVFAAGALVKAIEQVPTRDALQSRMSSDIQELLCEEFKGGFAHERTV